MNIPNYKDIPNEFKEYGVHFKNKWLKFQADWFFFGVKDMHFFKDEKEIPKEIWKPILKEIAPIQQSFDIKHEQKRLYTLLKYDQWNKDPYLRRMMRKFYRHGQTDVNNQIILDTGCYNVFYIDKLAWIEVMSLEFRKRIAIPLNTTQASTGTLRLILRNGRVEIHYAVDETKVCSTESCGTQIIGIDKGYTEVFTDSDGSRHGQGLGQVLSDHSDMLKTKYQNRNRLAALEKKYREQGKVKKANNIRDNNLGHKKLDHQKEKHKSNVRDIVFKATHNVVDKASKIVCEDLTSPIRSKSYGKNQNRRLSSWVKGLMAHSLNDVCRRRGASLIVVNASYTSQIDSRTGLLQGVRKGDLFYCADGAVLDADHNAAQNILARMSDKEISLFTPYLEVKIILARRFESRLGLLNQGISCDSAPLRAGSSTMCE